MISFPKPRGFWDYGLFALAMSGFLLLLFWLDASDGLRWADSLFALTAAALFVLAIILSRRGEKAKWIAQQTWATRILAVFGTLGALYGAMYADSYLFHRRGITSSRLLHDVVSAVVFAAVMLWWLRTRSSASRQL
jgi:hypothetical protein